MICKTARAPLPVVGVILQGQCRVKWRKTGAQGLELDGNGRVPISLTLDSMGKIVEKIPVTLLITTANNPPVGLPFLSMTNTTSRRIAAKAALYFWASYGVANIVLADATGSDLLSDAELDELQTFGARIEQIHYQQDSETISKRGKGYAEGKLVEFAVLNSRLIAQSGAFFKITGKTYVRNFLDIYKLINEFKVSTMVWKFTEDGEFTMPWADCRFYYTNKETALEHFVPAYLEADDTVASCEYFIFSYLERNLSKGKAPRPLVTGFSGNTDKLYPDINLGYLDLNFPCWFKFS